VTEDERTQQALSLIRLLADEVGPRRPTSSGERRAAEAMVAVLRQRGLQAALERFQGYSTFAAPYGLILGAAAGSAVSAGRLPKLSAVTGLSAAAAGAAESGLVHTPLSRALCRRPSQNLVASVDAAGHPARTLCLTSHLDSSRSGLMFHPGFASHLRIWIQLQSAAPGIQASSRILRRWPPGRVLLRAAQAVLAAGLLLLAQREVQGRDVPGANDNASGSAVAAQLAIEVAAAPLESTRVVLLMTGCEESGLLGSQAFLRAHDTTGWLFVNFDGVGGRATLRYLRQEGVGLTSWPADPAMMSTAERIAADRPELGLEAAEVSAGLTYDTSPVLARGGRALTLSVQDRTIPHYHRPSDTYANIDPGSIRRALAVGREFLARIDAGEADPGYQSPRGSAEPPSRCSSGRA
jgi:Peptidase family M28